MNTVLSHMKVDIVATRQRRDCLPLNPIVIILGSLVGIGLMPNHIAIAQTSTFYGVRVSSKFNTDSHLAQDWIKNSTNKYSTVGNVIKFYALGEWIAAPGTEDNYATYGASFSMSSKTKKSSVTLMTGTTSDSPKILHFSVDCAANKLALSSYNIFSPSGKLIGRKEDIKEPPVVPPNEFIQSLVNGACKLGD